MKEPIENPFLEAFESLTGKKVPNKIAAYLKNCFSSQELTENQFEEIQDWCGMCSGPVWWGTNIAIIDSCDIIVASAVENGNIREKAAK